MNEKMVAIRGDKTIEQVCHDLNLNPNMYEAYERGDRTPVESVLKEIADYFGVADSELVSK